MSHLRNAIRYGIRAISTLLVLGSIQFSAGIIANVKSPKINSQAQLEQLVEIERKKIDPQNNYNISATLFYRDKAKSIKAKEGDYQIGIGGFFANETTLRHELYHILDGHCEMNPGFQQKLKYWFLDEPKARIYQITGLKL